MTESLLTGCASIITFPVAWGDMDAFGHVNNVSYFKYFESGRLDCFALMGVLKHMEEHGQGPILAHTQCRFRLPLTWPDTISVGTRVSDAGADRFTHHYTIVSQEHGAVAAEGTGRIVWFDYKTQTKAPLPQAIRTWIDAQPAAPAS